MARNLCQALTAAGEAGEAAAPTDADADADMAATPLEGAAKYLDKVAAGASAGPGAVAATLAAAGRAALDVSHFFKNVHRAPRCFTW